MTFLLKLFFLILTTECGCHNCGPVPDEAIKLILPSLSHTHTLQGETVAVRTCTVHCTLCTTYYLRRLFILALTAAPHCLRN